MTLRICNNASFRFAQADIERWKEAEARYKKASEALKLLEQIQGNTACDCFLPFHDAASKLIEAALMTDDSEKCVELISQANISFLSVERTLLLRIVAELLSKIQAFSVRSDKQLPILKRIISDYDSHSRQLKSNHKRYVEILNQDSESIHPQIVDELQKIIKSLYDYKQMYSQVVHIIDAELEKASH